MNLTKVLFVAFIFLFALSFAAAAEVEAEAENQPEERRQLAIHLKRLAHLLVMCCILLVVGVCSELVLVHPKFGVMVWMTTHCPKSCFKVLQEASEDIKKEYLYQIGEWICVFYKHYSLPLEVLLLMFGVLSAANREVIIDGCVHVLLGYGIRAILFVGIDSSSYLRWEVPIPIEDGTMVSKPVKVSDQLLRMLIFESTLIRLVSNAFMSLNTGIQTSPLNRVQWVVLTLWKGAAPVLLGLFIIMFGHTITYHHPLIDTIAAGIVFIGIYVPLLPIIENVVIGMIFP